MGVISLIQIVSFVSQTNRIKLINFNTQGSLKDLGHITKALDIKCVIFDTLFQLI